MDWIKVLNKHILFEYSDLSDSEFRAWIKLMAVAGFLEATPTREQMLEYVHYKTIDSLEKKLKKRSIDLQYVFNKVSIDVQYVVNMKNNNKNRQQRFRGLRKNVTRDVTVMSQEREEKRREEKNKDNIILPIGDDKSSPCPHEKIIELYHKILPELPVVKVWTPKRQGYLRSRWKESPDRQNLLWWEKYFLKIKQSPFLTGNVTDFKATLEWVVNQSNMVKILEGKYDGGGGNVGIRTIRSDPSDKTLQTRTDAECEKLSREYYARKAASNNPTRTTGNDDAPDFSGYE